MMRLRSFLHVALCVQILAMVSGCGEDRTEGQNAEAFRKATEEVAAGIERCPPWSEIGPGDAAAQAQLLFCLEEIAAHDLDAIRDGMVTYIANNKRAFRRWSTPQESRLYILNKYLFELPGVAPRDKYQDFGGWRGVPGGKEFVDLQWPFSQSADGQLRLVGFFQGYMGPPYDGVEAFDYYRVTFPRRKSPMPEANVRTTTGRFDGKGKAGQSPFFPKKTTVGLLRNLATSRDLYPDHLWAAKQVPVRNLAIS